MKINHWLVKSEPGTYSWDNFLKLGRDHWDGVRNFQARNNLMAMKVGDRVLFYHSGEERAVIGIAEVVRAHYADPTTDDDRWVVVDLVPVSALKKPVTLKEIKADPALSDIHLIRNSRLSVMPLTKEAYDSIIQKGL